MRVTLKPLSEQVMVITGASSGIGLTTARAAAREGARVVLASRNLAVLEEIAGEIEREGGQALAVECDVGDHDAVVRLAARAVERFGRIDTWVNNAGVSIFGEILRTPLEDQRRLFDTNYWGVVYGSIVAIEHMRAQLESMGNSFSWDKSTSSTDPEYFAWTQWMFTQFFEHGIAYRGTGIVNWCPGCNTVIANEQVLADGTCERSGDLIIRKEMPQWMLRITKYADQLIDDLSELGWPEHIKEAQRQWIGRKRGAELPHVVDFDVM